MRSCCAALLTAALLLASPSRAFCGFYVSSAGAELFNDATMVVLMREGTRTVLSMQNNYRGPPDDFALVVPVPVVLQKENVKTLPKSVFARVDTLASPRLVEEYEPGACPPMALPSMAVRSEGGPGGGVPRDLGVKVEAKFDVAEYEIVVLSATNSTGLDIWLKENKYKIPSGAEPLLRPYVQGAWKFFVARVNAKKVKFENGQAVLSPLRFHYDAEAFALPVRLGLINSSGTQDLIVHLIGKSRYEIANTQNVTIPSNLRLRTRAQAQFGGWYAALVEKTFQKNPRAAITEFAWKGALPPPVSMTQQGIYGVTCDPCPPPEPVDDPLARYLGADVIPGLKTDEQVARFASEATLTRLHLRYSKDSLADDLVFKAVEPIAGGIPEQVKTGPAKANRFQGRYIVRKPFDPSSCYRGGGMPQSNTVMGPGAFNPGPVAGTQSKGALKDAFEALLLTDIPELDVTVSPPDVKKAPPADPKKKIPMGLSPGNAP